MAVGTCMQKISSLALLIRQLMINVMNGNRSARSHIFQYFKPRLLRFAPTKLTVNRF